MINSANIPAIIGSGIPNNILRIIIWLSKNASSKGTLPRAIQDHAKIKEIIGAIPMPSEYRLARIGYTTYGRPGVKPPRL